MKLAIVSPCYNEEAVMHNSAMRLSALLEDLISRAKISENSFILYINDGSHDRTWQIIEELFANNKFVCGINLSANVGHQNAIMAGMMTAKDMSDAVITIDADLQDDLSAIEQMIDLHADGNEVVYGVKVSRKADSFLKRNTALLFYKLQEACGINAIRNHADFRFMSRKALQQLSLYNESNLYLRGIIPMMGFKSATVDDVITERMAGKSKYTLCKMLSLAINGITSFSTKPVTAIFFFGIIFILISLCIAIYVIYSLMIYKVAPGWSSLMLSMWFIGGCILLSIGVVGQYIGKIYMEVKNRPLYTIHTILTK